jgi:DMSO reductase family type II enzyme molybdopterin subunit
MSEATGLQGAISRGLDRRGFLKQSGGALLSLGLLHLVPTAPRRAAAAPGTLGAATPAAYGDWADVWRERWKWDKVVHSSHTRANCISACSWNVFVKEGIAWREEQNAIYAASEPGVPDFNPRGCQKGACYTDLMYEPTRLMHPLRRVGERGSGQWKRVSWDDALGEIADKIIDASVEHGTGAVVYDHGTTNIDFGADTASELRFFGLLNSTNLDSWAGVGDMPEGAVQTLGMYNAEGTSDDWFKSDFLIVWTGNPAYTRMPEVHFMNEGRYRGGKLVVIAPDYNATAMHADYWANPRVGTDAALGLAMAQVILSEGLHDEEHIREQTDLPILVREDTDRYLRASDLRQGGNPDQIYFWDEATDALAEVPGCEGSGGNSTALGALRPTLKGRYRVRLADGTTVHVRPLLERLREHLGSDYTPEQAEKVTGVSAGTTRRLARELASVERAMIVSSWGACKSYHSDLAQRAKILLMALTGNQGKSGGGFRVASWWPVEGLREFQQGTMNVPLAMQMRLLWRTYFGGGLSWRDFEQLMQDLVPLRGNTPLMPFLYVHAGYSEIWDRPEYQDPAVPRATSEYMKEAVEKGWIPIRPAPGTDPKVFIFTGANPLRRWPAPQITKKHLWPKLDLIVDVNFKSGTSGLNADLILPTSGYYERDSIKYTQAYLPYFVLCEQAVEPLGESIGEWGIFGRLARKVQDRARARGVTRVKDSVGNEVDISTLYDDWSHAGKFHESDAKTPTDWILRKTSTTGNLGLAEGGETGLLPIVEAKGGPDMLYALGTDFKPGRTNFPYDRFVSGKEAWPTYSGRQQFLIEHPWYEEVGENLPVHKEGPRAGGDYPLRLTGGHTRWSIHATWRDSPTMLRLQRGEPAIWISREDAASRSVNDGDRIRVFNDVGEFEAIARVAPLVQPGQVIAYHAWEPYQFKNWKGQQEPVPAPWKAIHLAGGYGQIHYRQIYSAPGHHPRAQAVDFVRV